MKITRKNLKHLIEAFISGPRGVKHIPDEEYPFSKLEKSFGGKAQGLADMAQSSPEGEAQYEELADIFGKYDDYADDTREMFRDYDLDKDIGYPLLNIIKKHQMKDPELRYAPKRRESDDYPVSITLNTPNQATLKSIVQAATMLTRNKPFLETIGMPRISVNPLLDGSRKASEVYRYTAGKPYGERYLLMIDIGTIGLNSNASLD